MLKRLIGVFLLRPEVFRSIGSDPAATGQAAIVVTVVALISAVSAAISAVIWGVGFTAANTSLDVSRGNAVLTIVCSAIAVLVVNWYVVNPIIAGLF